MTTTQTNLDNNNAGSTPLLDGVICPNCFASISIGDIQSTQACQNCEWRYEEIEGIPLLLSSDDKSDSFFQDYFQNYEQISLDDLGHSIQPTQYLQIMSERFTSYVLNFVGQDISQLNVCELGVGQGHFFNKMAKLNPRLLVGVDISIPYLKQFKPAPNTQLVIANAENVPFKNQFDLLVASDILEHVINVGDFLYSTNRSLRKNGAFVVKVPFNEDINQYSRLAGCPYRFVHLRSFTEQSLRKVLESAGFKVEKILYDGFLDYRLKPFMAKRAKLKKLFRQWLQFRYQDDVIQVATINRHIGKLLMEPIEIVACCRKMDDVL